MAERSIAIRIAIRDAEQAARTLKSLGADGEAAFARIAATATPAGRATQLLGTAFDDLSGRVTASVGPFGGVAARLAAFGPAAAAGVAGIGALVGAVTVGVREAKEAEQSFARLQGVLRATGGSAGLTAGEIRDFAEELEGSTLATASGVQNAAAALATFRNVSGDTFTDAIALAQDMAAVFGGDIQSAAVQLGKALEDPERGITALRRSGVSFSEAQREVISNLVETGRTAEAQRLILDALANQVGGAGAAEADTLTGAFHRAADSIGDMLRAFDGVLGTSGAVRTALEGVAAAANAIGELAGGGSLADQLGQVNAELERLRDAPRPSPAEIGFGGAATAGLRGPATEQRQGEIAALEERRLLLEDQLRLERELDVQAARRGQEQQQQIRLDAARETVRQREEEIQKVAQRHETEAQGIARVNAELDKEVAKLRQIRETIEKSGGSAEDISRVSAAAAQARANAAADIANIQKPRLDKERQEREAAAADAKRAADEAARNAKRLADEQARTAATRREFVGGIERELQVAQRLQAAQAKGTAAYRAEQIAIAAENAVRGRKIDLSAEEEARLIDVAKATQEVTDATRERARVEQEAERDRQQAQDDFFSRADKDIEKEDVELKREAERQADMMADIFAQPFKDLTGLISGVASDTILEFQRSGELSGQAFAQRFAEGIQGLSANLVGTIVTAPINAAVSGLSSALQKAMAPKDQGGAGGGMMASLSAMGTWATANPLNAGLAGAAGGGLVGSGIGLAMGRPNSYASTGGSLGGAGGAALGLAVGGPFGAAVGGLLGSVGGSIFGGMFGGGDDNSGDNNMRQRFRPGQGVYYREAVQEGGEQNAQQVNQFMDQLTKAGKVFENAGLLINENFGAGIDLKVGSNSGITLDGKKYTSIEDALGAAIQQLGKRGYRAEGDNIMEQIARNTKATTAEGLAADFEFGKEYPRLIKGGGELGRSIDAVAERFEALKDKAAELGLSVSKLDAVQDEQIHRMKEEARLRIDMLAGDASEYRQALENLSATFEKAKQDAKDLGMSTERLNAARDRERERLEEEANIRVDMLSGKGGDYLQAQIALNAKYEEAKRIAIDLGRSTDDLNKARDRERDQLEDAAKQSIRRLTGDFGSLDEAMLQLNKTFEDAKLLANQLGVSTEKLNAARDHEREKLRASANADLRVMMGEWDPLANQILQLRNVFEAANENARDLGYTEERLIEARKRATAELIENRRREVEGAVASQAEQFRNFFSSILDPLKQAQSAFGGLQGIAAPSASIDAGLADFRDLAGRARKDDLSAIQQLPQLGQQLIQYARQYGASGAPANDIIREVQAAYAEMETKYRDRQLEVMQSIPEAVVRTGAEQIKAMQAEMNRVVEELRVLNKTIRANKSGLLTAA
jgi:phage-related minor tail protein